MTDADVQTDRMAMPSIVPAARAALAYIDGLHAFSIAVLRWDIAGMHAACDTIDDAVRTMAAQGFRDSAGAR